jgi:hypothetical protein
MPQQQRPHNGFIQVPASSVTVNSIMLWRGIGCLVVDVQPIDGDRTCIMVNYLSHADADTFDTRQLVYIWQGE